MDCTKQSRNTPKTLLPLNHKTTVRNFLVLHKIMASRHLTVSQDRRPNNPEPPHFVSPHKKAYVPDNNLHTTPPETPKDRREKGNHPRADKTAYRESDQRDALNIIIKEGGRSMKPPGQPTNWVTPPRGASPFPLP